MRFLRRGHLLTLALLGTSGSILAAENLPPLRIDPALVTDAVKSDEPPVYPAPAKVPADNPLPPLPAAAQPAVATEAPAADSAPVQQAIPVPPQAAGPANAGPPQAEQRTPLPASYPARPQANGLPEPRLKPSPLLVPLPRDNHDPLPTFISANRVSGKTDVESVAAGNVELRRFGKVLTTDHLTYWENDDEVEALGNVRLTMDQDHISGPKLRLRLKDSVGYFEQPQYSITRPAPVAASASHEPAQPQPLTTGTGHARRIDFEGKEHYRLTDATYSTCRASDPDWYVRAGSMNLDYDRQVGTASNAALVFKGVPVLYAPWLSFSLNNQRKSGFLSPSFGTTTSSGPEVSLPYFWNMGPNMDATVTPRVMARRGTQVGGEFRYLSFNYSGQMNAEYLPNDHLTHTDRSNISVRHVQNFGDGFSGSLNLNRVSDDTYFTDLASRIAVTSQINLPRQGTLSYSSSWWSANIMAQRFQTLQDPALPPVVIPYDRLPQLTVNAYRADLPLGGAFTFGGEYVDFRHPTSVLGKRTTLYPQFSLPLQTAAFYVTPKVGLHATSYSLERQAPGTPAKISSSVPVFSVDSGVTFERKVDWFGQNLTQTLEPRLFYLYVPNRDQSQIPIFDTGLADFNFAQIFSENRYSGGDRFGDANQLTAAITSRLVDPVTGSELLRGLIGQLYRFKQQEVTMPGEVAPIGKAADFLAALSGEVLPKTYIDTAWQYSPQDNRTNRLSIGGRYQPEVGKVINAGYRYSRDLVNPVSQINQINQIDISAQWPLSGGWYGVGRYNYAISSGSVIESMGGLEYNGGCWVGRFVLQRLATATGTASTGLFVQLELNGFSSIGSNPLEVLKRDIAGYSRINQPGTNPAVTE